MGSSYDLSASVLPRISGCRDVLGVGGGRVGGVAFDGSGGVSEGFGDDGDGCQFREFVECSESCGAGAEQLAQPRCEVSGVDVMSPW